MGNVLNCSGKQNISESPSIFSPVDNPQLSLSVTLPSLCETPSFIKSLKDSQGTHSSESFKWSRMQSLILQQEHFTENNLTASVLKVTSQVMEALKRHVSIICSDLQEGAVQVPDAIFEKFKQATDNRTTAAATTTNPPVMKKVIVHLVILLYLHDIVLSYFRCNQIDYALDFLKQVAVSHALKGVTPAEFRMMDWFLIRYLVKNKITNEDNINTFVLYLNTLSNYISQYYETQSVRSKMIDKLTKTKVNDRENKARENYRLMKKWAIQVEGFKDQDEFVDELLANLEKSKKSGDSESIDTLTLKQNDCIMKHFAKKPRKKGSFVSYSTS